VPIPVLNPSAGLGEDLSVITIMEKVTDRPWIRLKDRSGQTHTQVVSLLAFFVILVTFFKHKHDSCRSHLSVSPFDAINLEQMGARKINALFRVIGLLGLSPHGSSRVE
jgi:hypothetical protein